MNAGAFASPRLFTLSVKNVVDVHSLPTANGYANEQRFERGATATSLVLPELTIGVDEILFD